MMCKWPRPLGCMFHLGVGHSLYFVYICNVVLLYIVSVVIVTKNSLTIYFLHTLQSDNFSFPDCSTCPSAVPSFVLLFLFEWNLGKIPFSEMRAIAVVMAVAVRREKPTVPCTTDQRLKKLIEGCIAWNQDNRLNLLQVGKAANSSGHRPTCSLALLRAKVK